MKPVIVGAGLAGLTVALALAPIPVILLSARKLGHESSSALAQGGIAASVGIGDSAAMHADDTLKAGLGLGDEAVAHQVTKDAVSILERLMQQGVAFDRDTHGHFRLGLEAAHKNRRIVHAEGDGTGAAVMKALIAAVHQTPSIQIIENAIAVDVLADGDVRGVTIMRDGQLETIFTNRVVLATGGAGALWQYTTNPLSSWGQGLALAARAGAVLGDLEFMQFHPTAIEGTRDPMPLASEALRGEGAILIDEKGERFVDELATRDIVARAIGHHIEEGHRVFLDARQALGTQFPQRFPAIYALCKAAGFDPVHAPIPVRPAAHYHMGGVVADAHGRSSVAGLWVCGEVACTGLHGANRLASNSLLEAASFGQRVADDIKRAACAAAKLTKARTPARRSANVTDQVRGIMSQHVGMLREATGLERAVRSLVPLVQYSDMALVGLMIATAALRREESRGAHTRTDYPETSSFWQKRLTLTLDDVLEDNILPMVAGA